MTRLLLALGLTLLTIVGATSQTSGRVYRMAIISPAGSVSDLTEAGRLRVLFQELRRRGYVEGQNLTVERRSAEDRPERIPDLVRKVVALKPDLIFTTSGRVLQHVKTATTVVPAVGSTSDPVGAGLAASLARPGGNITGVSVGTADELVGKRLELVRELIPGATNVAFLTPRHGWESIFGAAAKGAAAKMGLSLLGPPLDSPIGETEYRRVVAAMAEQRPDALLVSDYGENMRHRQLIAELARVHRLPAVYPFRQYAPVGGMVTYGPDDHDLDLRLAAIVDTILQGGKPGDIPFYQPTRYQLIINLKSARDIGLDIPSALLTAADQVIELSLGRLPQSRSKNGFLRITQSALAGSMVGGLTLGLTSWLNERTRARARKLAHDLSRREDLFKDFIVAASKAYGEALMSNEPQIQELIALYAMISGMRVGCSPRTIACAEKVMRATTDVYAAPNKTIPQLHEMLKSGVEIDPLKDFAEAARDELSSLQGD